MCRHKYGYFKLRTFQPFLFLFRFPCQEYELEHLFQFLSRHNEVKLSSYPFFWEGNRVRQLCYSPENPSTYISLVTMLFLLFSFNLLFHRFALKGAERDVSFVITFKRLVEWFCFFLIISLIYSVGIDHLSFNVLIRNDLLFSTKKIDIHLQSCFAGA